MERQISRTRTLTFHAGRAYTPAGESTLRAAPPGESTQRATPPGESTLRAALCICTITKMGDCQVMRLSKQVYGNSFDDANDGVAPLSLSYFSRNKAAHSMNNIYTE